jgi:hypothetical protein
MAKGSKVVASPIDHSLLAQVVAATAANSFVYTSPLAHHPMLTHNPSLVEVNTSFIDPTDSTKFATRATPHAAAHLANIAAATAAPTTVAASPYAIIKGAVLPEPKKRGNSFGSGAPTKYPFATMDNGDSFFEPNSNHAKGDAVKALGSTVSSQNRKNSEAVVIDGQPKMKVVTRAIRDDDNKAKLDANGKKITETVTIPVLTYNKYFTIRAVEGGKSYGGWTAPADGALIARTK